MPEAVIVSGVRTPLGKGRKGTLRTVRPDDLAALVIREAVQRARGLDPADVGDVLMGCAIPEGEQGMNVARIASLLAGLPPSVPAATINRFCSSGLQTIAMAVDEIQAGRTDVVVAGGTETMSRVAMFGRSHPNPKFAESWPGVYLGMGLTAENLARKYSIPREEADRFSLESHQKAIRAIAQGKFEREIVPVPVEVRKPGLKDAPAPEMHLFSRDECPRADTTLEGLQKLKPVFAAGGTVTAGNASQMSDGAAAVVVMSRKRAEDLGLKPLAVLRSFAVAGVPPEIMGIGPVAAVPVALRQAGLGLEEIDIIELNEAFAVQALSVMKELGLPPEKVNVNGGAVALGHPLGATGARLVVTALHELERRGKRYALITMCVGGGMGAAGVLERLTE
ncbi:MAG TPA: thiolase family protein, partial [Planctomycetota bacterium]|nr:thiolase family protein [Planctomycetota bacterium]